MNFITIFIVISSIIDYIEEENTSILKNIKLSLSLLGLIPIIYETYYYSKVPEGIIIAAIRKTMNTIRPYWCEQIKEILDKNENYKRYKNLFNLKKRFWFEEYITTCNLEGNVEKKDIKSAIVMNKITRKIENALDYCKIYWCSYNSDIFDEEIIGINDDFSFIKVKLEKSFDIIRLNGFNKNTGNNYNENVESLNEEFYYYDVSGNETFISMLNNCGKRLIILRLDRMLILFESDYYFNTLFVHRFINNNVIFLEHLRNKTRFRDDLYHNIDIFEFMKKIISLKKSNEIIKDICFFEKQEQILIDKRLLDAYINDDNYTSFYNEKDNNNFNFEYKSLLSEWIL